MSTVFTLVAKIKAKAGQEEALKSELVKLIPLTLAEAGCMNYDLHTGEEEAGLFVFYENWETKDHWHAHNESAHIQAFMNSSEQWVESAELIQLRPY